MRFCILASPRKQNQDRRHRSAAFRYACIHGKCNWYICLCKSSQANANSIYPLLEYTYFQFGCLELQDMFTYVCPKHFILLHLSAPQYYSLRPSVQPSFFPSFRPSFVPLAFHEHLRCSHCCTAAESRRMKKVQVLPFSTGGLERMQTSEQIKGN